MSNCDERDTAEDVTTIFEKYGKVCRLVEARGCGGMEGWSCPGCDGWIGHLKGECEAKLKGAGGG